MTLPSLAGNTSNDEEETQNYTLADATLLNQLKNLIRDVTRTVDSLPMKVSNTK
jgi:hypothetical protein